MTTVKPTSDSGIEAVGEVPQGSHFCLDLAALQALLNGSAGGAPAP